MEIKNDIICVERKSSFGVIAKDTVITNFELNESGKTKVVCPSLHHKIIEALLKADQSSAEALLHFREAGNNLLIAKKELGHGEFGKWFDEHFQYGKTWRCRIMKLAEKWDVYQLAMSEREGGTKAHSVDEACKIISLYEKRSDGKGAESGAETDLPKSRKVTSYEKQLLQENTALQSQLDSLIAENARLKSLLFAQKPTESAQPALVAELYSQTAPEIEHPRPN